MRNSILFVINVQRDLMNTLQPTEYVETPTIFRVINEAIEKANQKNIMVIYIVTRYNCLKIKKTLRNDSNLAILDDRLRIVNDVVFTKRHSSAFSDEKLTIFLKEYQIRHVILIGLFMENSILNTARHAKKKGYHVTLIKDGIVGKSEESIEQIAAELQKEGIIIRRLRDIFTE